MPSCGPLDDTHAAPPLPRRSGRDSKRRLDDVLHIGDGVGANRVGGTPEEDEARALAVGWMEEAGLEVEVDGRGNLSSGGCSGGGAGARRGLGTGSHLDSVPEGGKFDGALGVVAGLEAVEAVGQSERTLGVVVFRDEETGCHGSRWRAANGSLPGAYVELHIEQGPALARGGRAARRGDVDRRDRARARNVRRPGRITRGRRRWPPARTR